MRYRESINYRYAHPSALRQSQDQDELLLAHYSEVQKKDTTCFFWGRLSEPFITARCLITLSQVVQSSFNLSPFERALLKDPIVTAGNDHIRFEGFSHCAGVYGRLDLLPDGHDGEFLENGTTNVDFNAPMLAALSQVRSREEVLLSVGPKEVGLYQEGQKTLERKVPLPTKWIKGLSTVQLFLGVSEPYVRLNRIQAQQLFRTLPKSQSRQDYYLIQRGKRVQFSPAGSHNAICIGGVHRLQLMAPLVAMADKLLVYAHPEMQSTTWVLHFGALHFLLSLSRESWRGFSGEGAALESLVEEVPLHWIERMDRYSYANQAFNPTLLAIEENLRPQQVRQLAARLSAMGLLGFDLEENQYFYRRLPFKLSRILSLNPRMKNAEKLLAEGKVQILSEQDGRTEARVEGSGVHHTVVITQEQARCTCTWFSRHQGERGPCKHILAVKKQQLSA